MLISAFKFKDTLNMGESFSVLILNSVLGRFLCPPKSWKGILLLACLSVCVSDCV